MELFNEVLNDIKIILYIDKFFLTYKVIIQNYEPIINFNNELVEFEHYLFYGKELKITKMGENEVEISGEIKEVKVKE